MSKTFYIILIAVFIFIGVNSFFYIRIFNQQLDFQTELLRQQIRICGNTIEQNGMNFESEVNYILFSENISLLFSDSQVKEKSSKNLEQFYTKYESLINYINIYDSENHVYRLLKDKINNYVSDFYESQKQEKLERRDMLIEENGNSLFTVPVFQDNEVHSNIVVNINFDKYINEVLDQYRLENTTWQWFINDEGELPLNHPGHLLINERIIQDIHEDIIEYNEGSIVHTINMNGEPVNVISVYYPVNLIRKDFGIVFSIKSDLFLRSIITKSVIITLASLLLLALILFLHFRVVKVKSKDARQYRRSEIALKRLIDELPVGLITVNHDHSVRTINKKGKQLLNVKSENPDILKNAVSILLESPSHEDPVYEHAFGKGKIARYRYRNFEIQLFLQQSLSAIEGQEVISIVLTDVSYFERNKQYKTVASLAKNGIIDKLKQEISGPLKHLDSIRSSLDKTQKVQEQKELVASMRKPLDLLNNLVVSLMEFSARETDKVFSQEIPFCLRNELNLCIDSLKSTANKKQISVISKIRNDVPDQLIGDPFLLRQVIQNLLEISIDKTSEGRILIFCETMSMQSDRVKLLFQVEDTGKDIPGEIKDLLEEASVNRAAINLERINETAQKILLSQQQAELMRGEFWVSSPSSISTSPEWPGTAFSFFVEFAPDQSTKEHLDFSRIKATNEIRCLFLKKDKKTGDGIILPFSHLDMSITEQVISQNDHKKISAAMSKMDQEIQILVMADTGSPSETEILALLERKNLTGNLLVIIINDHDQSNRHREFKKHGADYYLMAPHDYLRIPDIIKRHFHGIPDGGIEKMKLPGFEAMNKKLDILLVDDNILSRETARSVFKQLGYELDLAASGEEATSMLGIRKYDIVFMDLLMPERDGIETVTDIRKQGFDMPVIALTAVDQEEMIKKARQAGMNDYLPKPANLQKIRKILIDYFPVN